MKRFLKFGFAAVILASAIFASFAFTGKSTVAVDNAKFAVVYYEFIGAVNPPTMASQITTVSNWSLEASLPAHPGSGPKFAAIEFNNSSTTLNQALNILAARFASGYTDGATYTSGAQSVKIYLKS